jgi:galactofuranose transport system substrate-binding protein
VELKRTVRSIAGAVAVGAAALALGACGSSSSSSDNSASSAAPSTSTSTPASTSQADAGSGGATALQQTLAFAASNQQPSKKSTIAWVKADATNPYTLAEEKGGLDAAKKFGVSVKVFAASFNPATQAQQLQNALTGYHAGRYQGILVEPVAGQVICPQLKAAIASGVPVAIDNGPICGAVGYYPGTVGYAGMQIQPFFNEHVENAFKSCNGQPCQAAVITGPVGFDNVTRLENAVKTMSGKYPNVKVVVNQPTDFSAQQAFTVMRNALTAHPDINLVVTDWDDMMTGVIQAIKQAGKQPGTQIRIYSNGADKTGVGLIQSGQLTESSVLMPYEEGNYAMYQLIRFLVAKQKTPGTVFLADSPVVKKGPGTITVTKSNVDRWKPEY